MRPLKNIKTKILLNRSAGTVHIYTVAYCFSLADSLKKRLSNAQIWSLINVYLFISCNKCLLLPLQPFISGSVHWKPIILRQYSCVGQYTRPTRIIQWCQHAACLICVACEKQSINIVISHPKGLLVPLRAPAMSQLRHCGGLFWLWLAYWRTVVGSLGPKTHVFCFACERYMLVKIWQWDCIFICWETVIFNSPRLYNIMY